MTRRILTRVAVAPLLLIIISILVFLISQAGPADPVKSARSQTMTPAEIAELRATYGLDQSVWQQYFSWLHRLFTDGGGRSLLFSSRVSDIVLPALGNTALLTAAATVVAVVIGVLVGFLTGARRGSWTDRILTPLVQLGSNFPVYWLGLVVIWVGAVTWHLIPPGGKSDLRTNGGPLDVLQHLVAPAVVASLVSLLIIARLVRSQVDENTRSDYFRTYRSQGFARGRVLRRHVGRNVLPIIVNTTGLTIGSLLTGVVFVETVFSWPGIGSLLLNSISGGDYPVIQAGILFVAAAFVIINLVVDIIVDLLNPRLRSTT